MRPRHTYRGSRKGVTPEMKTKWGVGAPNATRYETGSLPPGYTKKYGLIKRVERRNGRLDGFYQPHQGEQEKARQSRYD